MRAGPSLQLSVVVSTYNRSHMLAATVESLLAQRTSVEFEVIVVDNNSTDDTASVIHSYEAVRYVFEPRQGVAYGRNAGIETASAALIAFTDDDVVAAPDWVEQIVLAFRRQPAYGCIGGKVLPNWPGTPPDWLTVQHWSPLALLDYGAPQSIGAENPKCLVTANMAVRREMLEQIGNFSPQFQKTKGLLCAGEDREIQERYWRAGGHCWFEPAMVVYAEIQKERLTKNYHRKWHYGHGQFNALLEGAKDRMPLYMYKRFAVESAAAVGNYLTGHKNEAFGHELAARYAAGYINGRSLTATAPK